MSYVLRVRAWKVHNGSLAHSAGSSLYLVGMGVVGRKYSCFWANLQLRLFISVQLPGLTRKLAKAGVFFFSKQKFITPSCNEKARSTSFCYFISRFFHSLQHRHFTSQSSGSHIPIHSSEMAHSTHYLVLFHHKNSAHFFTKKKWWSKLKFCFIAVLLA